MGEYSEARATEAATTHEPPARPGSERFRHLPDPIRLEDTVAEQPVDPPADPTMGRDAETAWLLRYAQ